MVETKGFGHFEKNGSSPPEHDVEQGTIIDRKTRGDDDRWRSSLTGRKTSVAESIVAADLLDERYATTQRGLKSRHAQMIALGG